jgi:hypothetical protein
MMKWPNGYEGAVSEENVEAIIQSDKAEVTGDAPSERYPFNTVPPDGVGEGVEETVALNQMKVVDLRDLAHDLHVEDFETLPKADLIKAIRAAQAEL